jgi:hypothetical protein
MKTEQFKRSLKGIIIAVSFLAFGCGKFTSQSSFRTSLDGDLLMLAIDGQLKNDGFSRTSNQCWKKGNQSVCVISIKMIEKGLHEVQINSINYRFDSTKMSE